MLELQLPAAVKSTCAHPFGAHDLASAAIITDETDCARGEKVEPAPIATYFATGRFVDFRAGNWICFLLYFPFGLLLLILRSIATLLLAVLLVCTIPCRWGESRGHSSYGCSAHHMIISVFSNMLVTTTVHGAVAGKEGHRRYCCCCGRGGISPAPVVVSNHLSELDFFALAALYSVRVVAMDHLQHVLVIGRILRVVRPIYITQAGNRQSAAAGGSPASATHREEQKAKIAGAVAPEGAGKGVRPAVLLFPEGVLTNGKVAVLRYQKFIFSLGMPVQPLALRHRRRGLSRCLPVPIDTLPATAISNIMWIGFMPRQHYDIHVLPIVSCGAEESAAEFADRVQAVTAAAVGLEASRWGNRDKNAFTSAVLSDSKLTADAEAGCDKGSDERPATRPAW